MVPGPGRRKDHAVFGGVKILFSRKSYIFFVDIIIFSYPPAVCKSPLVYLPVQGDHGSVV